jgi:hypothetical protein
MLKVPVIVLSFILVSLSGCGAGNSVKNAGSVQYEEGIGPKESKQTNVSDPGSSTRSISLDDLLGNTNSKSDNKSVYKMPGNSSPWKYYTGPDGIKRQDISGVEWVVLEGGKGKSLTQAMVGQKLRRYVIIGSFDLGGKTIRMPYGSVLDLESGSLSNGALVFDDTRVTPVYAISKQTKLNRVKVSGTYYETLVDLWGATEEPLFPWDTTAPKKVYTVDLKKFGITPGYQKKGSNGHYSDRQYDLMYNNGVGFTNAIQWAYKNGYDGIRFPKNDYCFTPRTTDNNSPAEGPIVLIQDLDKFDIDLGNSTCYLVLDSSHKSKYYRLTPDKPYEQGGHLFFVAACINLQIHNGKMIGDRRLRDYSDGAERSFEKSYAISLSAHCHNVRIHHLDLCDFMADGISILQTGNFYDDYNGQIQGPLYSEMGTLSFPKYVLQGGRVVESKDNPEKCTVSNSLRLDYLYRGAKLHPVIAKIAALRYYSINNNRGYTRIPNIYSNLEVLSFTSKSKDLPSGIIPASYLERVYLAPSVTDVKFQCRHDDGVKDPSFKHTAAISEVLSSDVVIEYCSIHDNHRGGITGGSNNNLIRFCSFSKNVTDKNYSGKTIPSFLVGGTNYHINYEDSFAKDLEVEHCTFSRDNNSIGKLLFGVFTFSFHDNRSDAGMIIYNNIFSDVRDNVFRSSGISFSGWAVPTDDMFTMKSGLRYMCRVVMFHNNVEKNASKPTVNHRTLLYLYDNKN